MEEEQQIKKTLESEMDVSFEVEKVESMEAKNEEETPLRTVANELLARIRQEAASGRWSGLNPNDFSFLYSEEAVGMICSGFIPQTISLNVWLDRWGNVFGEYGVIYCDNLSIESGPLEAVSRFFHHAMYDHLEAFLRIKQEELNAAFGSKVWHIERCEPRSIYEDDISLFGPNLSQDAAFDAFCRLLDVMLHEPRSPRPVIHDIQAVNDYIECVDGEEKKLAQAYAQYMQLRINYELERLRIDHEHFTF